MIKKVSRKWRINIDYTNLNKTCPKDNFPLSKINQLVIATSKCKLLVFIDTSFGHK